MRIRSERDDANGKKSGERAWRHFFARKGAGNLSFAGGGKKAMLSRVTAGVADFSRKGTERVNRGLSVSRIPNCWP
jgi:hypothetical protein